MADAPPGRVPTRCDTCLQFDTHPKHIQVTALDPVQVAYKHWDCCRGDGCPDGHCTQALLAAEGAHGDHLVAWIEAEMAAGRR